MIVISDTTALTNLMKIGQAFLLKSLYGEIIIPIAVETELKRIVQHHQFLKENEWILVEKPRNILAVNLLRASLGEGESEAIILAKERNADFLIMDEMKGRAKAKEMGLKIIGLLGILIEAKQLQLIGEIKPLLDQLRNEAKFFINPTLYQRVLDISGE